MQIIAKKCISGLQKYGKKQTPGMQVYARNRLQTCIYNNSQVMQITHAIIYLKNRL